MNTHEVLGCFQRIAKCRPSTQYSVVPCDKLTSLNILSYPFMVCMNTDDSTKPGAHWIGLYIARHGAELEMFDSYGLPFDVYPKYIRDFAIRNDLRIVQTRKMLQSPFTKVCGHYVVAYMFYRLRGCSRASYYARFSNDLFKNDKLVYYIVNKIFIKRISCKYFQTCTLFNKVFS